MSDRRRRGLLEQVIRRLQLASEPFRDSRAAVVRLVAELLGELAFGLGLQQGDVPGAVVELGVGEGDKRERSRRPARVAGSLGLAI